MTKQACHASFLVSSDHHHNTYFGPATCTSDLTFFFFKIHLFRRSLIPAHAFKLMQNCSSNLLPWLPIAPQPQKAGQMVLCSWAKVIFYHITIWSIVLVTVAILYCSVPCSPEIVSSLVLNLDHKFLGAEIIFLFCIYPALLALGYCIMTMPLRYYKYK